MPSKRKKMRQEKRKKRGGEKAKSKSHLQILLSAHTRTSQVDILHLDQKAAKCTTCKPVCGTFQLFIARQWPENHSTSFKTRFSAKSPGANGLNNWRKGSISTVRKGFNLFTWRNMLWKSNVWLVQRVPHFLGSNDAVVQIDHFVFFVQCWKGARIWRRGGCSAWEQRK